MPPKAVHPGAKPKAAKRARGKARPSPARVEEIFRRFAQANPHPKGELEYVNPYTLLVAVVLSAQATDAGVNKATHGLFKAADTPAKMLALGLDEVQERVKTIGLYRNKAKNVIALSERLLAEHGGHVPKDREALEALPGVGRKTANVVLGNAFGISHGVVVDTHVLRLSARLGLTQEMTPAKVELALQKLVPQDQWTIFSHWLIWHGRRRCFARNPDCAHCEIRQLCPSAGKI